MIHLTAFQEKDFDRLIKWVDSPLLLLTIAGWDFTFPLTRKQLASYLVIKESKSFNVVLGETGKIIGHAELIDTGVGTCKIDKVIIGDKDLRGKGIGEELIRALVSYAREMMQKEEVELNVFDWNTSGIRCYEKVGFIMNPEKEKIFEFEGEEWTALNMKMKVA